MSVLRLVMVTPRYWPLVGETERFASHLAVGLRPHVETTVLTARWSSDWPADVRHRETPVVRLPSAPRGGWGTFRYARSVARWLRHHQREVDVVYAMNLRQDAWAATRALRGARTAIVLRAQGGDCRWLETVPWGRRLRHWTCQADAIVAPARAVARELESAGHGRPPIHVIANGVEAAAPRTAALRYQARLALAEANPDLAAAEYAPVAVSVGSLEDRSSLFALVEAWRPIAARWPSAKLWLLGDGPVRQPLYERIVDRGLHRQVLLPGTFDDLSDVFYAADLFVAWGAVCDGGQFLLEAMAAGLPVVAADTEAHRELVAHGAHGLLVPRGVGAALAEAIGALLADPARGARCGENARRRVLQGFTPARMAGEHRDLFQRIVERKRRGVP